jgi:hypothetical protein
MSNGRKQNDDDDDVDDEEVADVTGGAIAPRGYDPVPVGPVEEIYPRVPGGPIVKIDPPADPAFEWKNIYKV